MPASETVEFVKLLVPAGTTGRIKSSPLKPTANGKIRQVNIDGENHHIDRQLYLKVGKIMVVNGAYDLRSFSTTPHNSTDSAPDLDQDDEITLEIIIPAGAAPSADTNYVAAISYWINE